MTSQARPVDLAPLTAPVGRWDAQYFVDQVKSRPAYGHWHLTRVSLGWTVAALVALLGAEVAVLSVYVAAPRAWTAGETLLLAAVLALVAVLYATLTGSAAQGIRAPARVRALARLIRFANRNGLAYEPIAPNRDYAGPRFAGLYLRDRVADPTGAFDYGQRLRPGRHGAHAGTSAGWYLAVHLGAPHPPALLTAHRRDDRRSALPLASVGGDARFTLRCHPDDAPAVRAVFTPELLALLLDGRASCDAELTDRHLLVFPHRSAALVGYGDAALHRRLLRIVQAVPGRAASRTPMLAEADAGRLAAPRARMLGVVALVCGLLLPLALVSVPFWAPIAAVLPRP